MGEWIDSQESDDKLWFDYNEGEGRILPYTDMCKIELNTDEWIGCFDAEITAKTTDNELEKLAELYENEAREQGIQERGWPYILIDCLDFLKKLRDTKIENMV